MTYGVDPYGSSPYGGAGGEGSGGGSPSDSALVSGAWGGAPWASFAWGGTPDVVFPSAGPQENIAFLHAMWSDGATLSTAETAAVAVTNLLNIYPSQKWRSTKRYDSIFITLPRGRPVDAIGLRHDMSPAGMWRLRCSTVLSTLSSAPDVADSGWTSVWPLGVKPSVEEWSQHVSLLRFDNGHETPLRYLRLDLADTGRTYVEASRLMVGQLWQPLYNVSWDSAFVVETKDVQIDSDYGGLYPERRAARRIASPLKFPFINRDDAQNFGIELERRLGLARDVMCFIDPAATDDFHLFSIHGLLPSTGIWQPQPAWDGDARRWTYSASLSIKELLR